MDPAARLWELKRAVADLREGRDALRLATALQSLGSECVRQHRAEEARQHFEESLALLRGLDRHPVVEQSEVVVLWGLGAAYRELGQLPKALEALGDALARSRELDDVETERKLLQALGRVSSEAAGERFEQGQLSAALPHADAAVAYLREAGERSMTAVAALQVRGALRQRLGHIDDALADLTLAREMLAEVRDQTASDEEAGDLSRVEAAIANAIGAVCKDMGRFEEALEHCQEALAVRREAGDSRGEGISLNDLGVIHLRLGDYEASLRCSEEALALAREIGDLEAEAVVGQNLAWLYAELGRPNEAMALLGRALEIHRSWKNRRHQGWLLLEMGDVMSAAEPESADGRLANYLEAQRAFREVGDRTGESMALSSIAGLLTEPERLDEALRYAEQALAVIRDVGDPVNESRALTNLTKLHQLAGQPRQALQCAERGVEIVESTRGGIASSERRANYFATVGELYAAYACLLVDLGEPERAFHVSERGRARAFLDLLAEARVDVQGEGPEHEAEQRLLSELSVLRQRLLEARAEPANGSDPELISELERSQHDLEQRLLQLEAEARRSKPRHTATIQATAWTVDQVRERLLDGRTALLEYVLADPRSLLFCVTESELHVYDLPAGEEIEAQIRELRESLLSYSSDFAHGYALYRTLIEPAADLIRDRDLLVCPDGALHYLPFAVLLTGAPERFDYQALPYLLRDHAIAYAPSATVAAMTRERLEVEQPSYDAELAAFGDPQGLEDEVEESAGGGRRTPLELAAALSATRSDLAPIPRTADEVWAVARLLLPASSLPLQRPESFDCEPVAIRTATAATKDEVQRLTSGNRSFRFFHIATHGLLDSEKPQFSGLVFTPSDGVDPFWRTFEIFKSRIPSEVVVLSACETGLGRIVSGEGIVGLSRAFLYAGASSVCVSLWKVTEDSSPILMRAFYERALGGETPARALRGAQLELLEDTAYAHPYWWAPFVMVGAGFARAAEEGGRRDSNPRPPAPQLSGRRGAPLADTAWGSGNRPGRCRTLGNRIYGDMWALSAITGSSGVDCLNETGPGLS